MQCSASVIGVFGGLQIGEANDEVQNLLDSLSDVMYSGNSTSLSVDLSAWLEGLDTN